jgi:hypothetical protein
METSEKQSGREKAKRDKKSDLGIKCRILWCHFEQKLILAKDHPRRFKKLF